MELWNQQLNFQDHTLDALTDSLQGGVFQASQTPPRHRTSRMDDSVEMIKSHSGTVFAKNLVKKISSDLA